MKQRKEKSVYSIYMKNFIRIIIIPIIIIGVLAMSILLNQSHKAIETNMKLVEKNIVDLLESEINNSSIQFSSFLLINNNKILDTIARYNIEEGPKRYEYQELIKSQFNLLSIPKLELIGFYMKNDNEYFIKNYFTLTRDEVEDREWYKKAVDVKDSTYSKEKDKVLSGADINQPDIVNVIYKAANDDFTDISAEVKFDYKKLGSQFFIEGFDFEGEMNRLNELWKEARKSLNIQ